MKSFVKILIVDDEENIRNRLKTLLKTENYSVETASNGNTALEKIKKLNFHIVLLDIMMPGMQGDRLLSEIKTISPDTAVLIITGYPSIESAVKTLKDGAEDYIQKPFDFEKIKEIIEKIIKKKNLIIDVDDYILSIVAKRLKKLRLSQKTTLKELSRKIGLSISLCSQIENAKVMPSLLSLYKISKGLHSSLSEVVRSL